LKNTGSNFRKFYLTQDIKHGLLRHFLNVVFLETGKANIHPTILTILILIIIKMSIKIYILEI